MDRARALEVLAASVLIGSIDLMASGCRREHSSEDVGSIVPPKERVLARDRTEALRGLAAPTPRDAMFHRGVALGLFASTRDPKAQRAIYRQLLDELRALGATDVELVVEWSQADVSATEIAPDPVIGTDDELLGGVIDDAHARALRVFLMPILRIARRAESDWRGTIRPRDWDAWWTAYRAFVLHYADLGAQRKVELLSVGSELVSTEAKEEKWRALIADVRMRFQGRLTYSANWDHFEPIRFWDALDVAGVTAYQPLTSSGAPADEHTLDAGWAPFVERVRRWAQERSLRYLFTEVGYPSHAQGARRPWDAQGGGGSDLPLQVRCYRAMFKTWQADPRLAGIYVWNWFGTGGSNDQGYTPRGKPAEEVLRYWFERSRAGF